MSYLEIIKKFIFICLIFILMIITFKLTIFYIPFLIAYIISIIVEPVIKWLNKKTSINRKVCSIIVLVSIFAIIVSLLILGGIKFIQEATNLLSGLNTYLEKTATLFLNISSKFRFDNLSISKDVISLLQTTTTDYLNMFINYIKELLTKIIEYITAIPNLFINIVITILATYFITSDKFYILDRMEHHLSKKMVGKIMKHLEAITSSLGSYIKAEIILSIITFLIVLTGLNIFCLIGMEIEFPILMALLIGFIDVLPILGAGSIMVPWSVILILNNNYSIALAILGLFIFTVIIKQLIEPKLVSKHISIHPIFTLVSMYTGFKLIGIIGLIIGPIILIVLKNIFAENLDKGILNSIVDN